MCTRMNPDPYISPYTKLDSKWIKKDLNIRPDDPLNLTGKSREVHLHLLAEERTFSMETNKMSIKTKN